MTTEISNTEPAKKNTINDLRDVLFETLLALKDEKSPMDLDRARMINDTAQTIINSAKVEVDHIRAVGSGVTDFIPRATAPALPAPPPAAEGKEKLPKDTQLVDQKQGVTVTRHTLK